MKSPYNTGFDDALTMVLGMIETNDTLRGGKSGALYLAVQSLMTANDAPKVEHDGWVPPVLTPLRGVKPSIKLEGESESARKVFCVLCGGHEWVAALSPTSGRTFMACSTCKRSPIIDHTPRTVPVARGRLAGFTCANCKATCMTTVVNGEAPIPEGWKSAHDCGNCPI